MAFNSYELYISEAEGATGKVVIRVDSFSLSFGHARLGLTFKLYFKLKFG